MAPTDWILVETAGPLAPLLIDTGDWVIIHSDPIATHFAPSAVELVGASGVPVDGDGSCFPAP